MKWIVVLVLLAVMLNGCALLGAPIVEEGGTLVEMAGSGASGVSGVMGTESTVDVNSSWIDNNKMQTRYMYAQLEAMRRKRDAERSKRAASVGILREMAASNHDPRLADLAQWVNAGGDPQFALNYALSRARDDAVRRQTVRILKNLSERENNPRLYQLALWVDSGGDAKFALDYALKHSRASDWASLEAQSDVAQDPLASADPPKP